MFALGLVTAAVAWGPLALVGTGLAATVLLALPVAGLAAAALSVPFASVWQLDLGVGNLTLAPVLLVGAAGAWALWVLSARHLSVPAWRDARVVVVPLLAFLAVLCASAWAAPDVARAAVDIARWVELLLAVLLAAALAARRGKAELLVMAMLAAGALEAVVGWRTAHAGAGPESFVLVGAQASRAYGSFGQPNPFGAYMNMVWPLGVGLGLGWLWDRSARWPLAAGGLASAGLCLAGLELSWSRGAWLGAAAAAAAMGLVWLIGVLRRPVDGWAAATAWAAVTAGLAVVAAGPAARLPSAIVARAASAVDQGLPTDVSDAEVTDDSFATIERVAHWQAAVAMWEARPWLGQGPGQYELAYAEYRLPRWPEPLGHAHNIYLHVLAEDGLLGLAAFLAFLAGALTLGVRAALRPSAPRQRALGLAVVGVVSAVMAHGTVDYVFVHDMTIQMGLLLGLAAAAGVPAA